MTRRDAVEIALDRLSALRSAPDTPALHDELRSFLRNRSNLVVAKAAKIAGEGRISSVTPDLIDAAQRLFKDPARLDKRCAALTAIITTLYELDHTEPNLYLQCIRHVQMEPSFGPPVDAAAHLRGFAAQGLVRTHHPEALDLIVNLLVDPEPPARIGAIRALAANGGSAGNLALRLKILTGDGVVDVIAECFAGMLLNSGTVAPESTVAFVADYMDSDDPAIAEAAVLALGASHSSHAIAFMKEKWNKLRAGPLRKVLILSLAASRNEEALAFLIAHLETCSNSTASEILTALAAQRPSASIRQSIRSTLAGRKDASLLAVFERDFPAPT